MTTTELSKPASFRSARPKASARWPLPRPRGETRTGHVARCSLSLESSSHSSFPGRVSKFSHPANEACPVPVGVGRPPAPRRPERAPLAHVVAVLTTATFVPRLPRAACSRGLEAHTRVPRDSRTPRRLVPSARVTEERSGTGWASTWSVSSARKPRREPPGSEARRLVPAGGAAKPRVPSLAPAQDPQGSCVPPAPCTWRTRRLGIYQKDKRLARSVRRRGRQAVPGAGGGRKRFPG